MNDVTPERGHETIKPAEFEPSAGHAGTSRWVQRAVLGATLLALFLLAFFAWIMFTSNSVRIAFDPEPETVDLDGGLLRINLGDRWLLRPGEYQVSARLEGYHPFDRTIEVADAGDQTFEFALDKLPGYLTLNVAPQDVEAQVSLDGEPVGRAPLESLELEEGVYELAVGAERYQPFLGELVIEGGGKAQQMDIRLDPDWGEVRLESEPAGATLHVDGEPVGETPLNAEVMSGRHQLELRLEGYKPWSREIEIEAMRGVELPTVLLEKADHRVRVASVPAGASVMVDGEYRGQTPMQLTLRPEQSYEIVFSKPGYRSNRRQLEVIEGDETRLAVRLEPVLGTVTVEGTPAQAEVYVDGALRGVVNEPLELPAHPHRIEVRSEGYRPFNTTVTPDPDVEQRIEVALVSQDEIERARMPDLLDTAIGYQLKLFRPSGIFRMGSPRREQGRRSNEFMRQVQLERPFYLGLREVTNEQFAEFSAEHDSGVVERETLALKQQPVVRVSWDQAARFCNWLSRREGLPAAYTEKDGRMVPVSPMTTGYRLPTEAEWALVARYGGEPEGRAGLKYPWGESMPPPQGAGNFAGAEAASLLPNALSTYRDPFPATAQVGQFAANVAGLFDLGGNVSEWMHDFYLIRVSGMGTIPVDPLGPADGEQHVIRGASWRSGSITELRLAWRGYGLDGGDDIGFRVARYAE